ncbi:unnamed protein product, partial [Urochloa humidicola]
GAVGGRAGGGGLAEVLLFADGGVVLDAFAGYGSRRRQNAAVDGNERQ